MTRLCLLGFLLFQTVTAWAIKPIAAWLATPDKMGLTYQSLTLTTPDHVQLAAWLIAPAVDTVDQHTTIVLARGLRHRPEPLVLPGICHRLAHGISRGATAHTPPAGWHLGLLDGHVAWNPSSGDNEV
ncbi:MAG: hypothetical protein EOO61_09105 [Hymenobacter sp.]|nr:MAG: hypothetical protein EOO61_09105 [Hymenobacter sp.]